MHLFWNTLYLIWEKFLGDNDFDNFDNTQTKYVQDIRENVTIDYYNLNDVMELELLNENAWSNSTKKII